MSPSPSDVGIIYPRLSRRISFFQPAYDELDEENHVLSDNRRPREGIPRLSFGSIVGSPRENEPPGRLTHPPHSNPRLSDNASPPKDIRRSAYEETRRPRAREWQWKCSDSDICRPLSEITQSS